MTTGDKKAKPTTELELRYFEALWGIYEQTAPEKAPTARGKRITELRNLVEALVYRLDEINRVAERGMFGSNRPTLAEYAERYTGYPAGEDTP